MKHLLSPLDLSVDETEDLLNLASRIAKDPEKFSHCCDGKKLATLFYEPSTRTRLSFEAAMYHAMPISVQCAIQRKVLLWLPLRNPGFR